MNVFALLINRLFGNDSNINWSAVPGQEISMKDEYFKIAAPPGGFEPPSRAPEAPRMSTTL
jgi:hypothetical protein